MAEASVMRRATANPLLLRMLLALAMWLTCALEFEAQKKEEVRHNDPRNCPYCHGDPALMKASGLVSHYGFAFSTKDTARIDEFMPSVELVWAETEHFRLGMYLPSIKMNAGEREKYERELTRLNAALPEVSIKTKVFDSWLRLHLYALRVEDVYARMLKMYAVEQSDFPATAQQWTMQGKYMGEGPHMGQSDKYEVLVLPTKQIFTDFLRTHYGVQTSSTQRWNVATRGSLNVTIHLEQGALRRDSALHGHIGFNLAHMLWDGYKFYAYDTPAWIREGLAHVVEREIDPKYNSFDASEGAGADMSTKENWLGEVRALIKKGTAPRLAELVALKTFAEFKLAHHYTTWSMIDYMLKEHAAAFAQFAGKLKGRINAEGRSDGSRMIEFHRDAFRECFKMGYSEFDAAWQAWVLAIEVPK
ncbi:MAG: hypothetical protein FJ299_01380 [Planctomycetes bacterium]|nr:hypothetical protein [Planctomycetota bacterium]